MDPAANPKQKEAVDPFASLLQLGAAKAQPQQQQQQQPPEEHVSTNPFDSPPPKKAVAADPAPFLLEREVAGVKGTLAPPAAPPDHFAAEPHRPRLIPLEVVSERPYVAASPLHRLADALDTPADLFFLRSHYPTPPDEEAAACVLEVADAGGQARRFTIDALRSRCPAATVRATLQCAANRKARGAGWVAGCVSTGAFGGVWLGDLFTAMGLRGGGADAGRLHVLLEGRDRDPATGAPYAASVPLARALDTAGGGVLLAFELNGKALGRDHGGPLRAVVPGASGERSVKWLARVSLAAQPTADPWKARGYKGARHDWDAVFPFAQAPATVAICEPADGARVAASRPTVVRGYAFALDGRRIGKVEVSADGGRTWHPADCDPAAAAQGEGRAWAWLPWRVSLMLAPGPAALSVRAFDARGELPSPGGPTAIQVHAE